MRFLIIAAMALLLCACTGTSRTVSVVPHMREAARLAAHAGFRQQFIEASPYILQSWSRPTVNYTGKLPLYLFIEGDGRAFIGKSRISPDPTPTNPVGLKLAIAAAKDLPEANIVYIARPCQYLLAANPVCTRKAWTSDRFSPTIRDSFIKAIRQEIGSHDPDRVVVTGFSGGAALALLAAARVPEIDGVITIAGNLDIDTFTRHHRVRKMSGSLNPAEIRSFAGQQYHLHVAGAKDRVAPPALIEDYIGQHGYKARTGFLAVLKARHDCCWSQEWKLIHNHWLALKGL